ncbi:MULTISPECIES: tRNA-(ms[2]io[6]A)-hydroxylase [Cyanophyceae]|uniref:tRNA-(ms[2]io[6]A)-hydroxylase n=1 Tax=Cyanophyceae TaxID=3028117 RepID=UPI0016859D6F|nr:MULTISPECIES: tRNA-(ms[2]io[6]A)-hydroxylase [Cyanophyceae]MBD1915926.1 tRNA-(ms[2]io[6]A)-hydroxylase [Phormidium sp. FACHB-77]MBD2030400.1 tRNA-(ms[2]io[6]A)-hydroxylase [Phormidium sp. FACHB-322]MBD2053402.1 tRNA-(ms[2]io[6]A)-hydroxylase [Leptolyngbya sp. FACHB-60]
MATATIKFLEMPTSQAWVEQALANLDVILVDHAQCERKAAGVAMSLINRYPSDAELVKALTAIAQEELAHFAQVNQWLERRDIPFGPLPPPPYGAALHQQVRSVEPHRQLDVLLVSALIEARSHERLGLLGQHCPDPELAQFYRSLMASEARHYGAYWVLATGRFPRAEVEGRLAELAAAESEILTRLHPQPRVHS